MCIHNLERKTAIPEKKNNQMIDLPKKCMLGRVKQLSPTFFVQHSASLRCHRGGAHEWKNRLEVIHVSDHKDVNTKSLKLKSFKKLKIMDLAPLCFKYYSIQYTVYKSFEISFTPKRYFFRVHSPFFWHWISCVGISDQH